MANTYVTTTEKKVDDLGSICLVSLKMTLLSPLEVRVELCTLRQVV